MAAILTRLTDLLTVSVRLLDMHSGLHGTAHIGSSVIRAPGWPGSHKHWYYKLYRGEQSVRHDRLDTEFYLQYSRGSH